MDEPSGSPDSATDPLIGRVVDGYRIDRLLGAGGMGRVYRAHDSRLDRNVAIKFLARSTPEQEVRFQREALAISAINDPNVAAIFTRGVYAGQAYYVMEYLDGDSLARCLSPGERLALPRAIDFLQQAARGLAAAAERGLIHRDVKPSNLMLQGSDRLKVVDFGLARRLGGDLSLTETDTTIGTPHYISPEQALGQATDHRSDIYSLGATFYHLLSGFPPFEAETPVSLLLQHVNSPLPPLRSRNPRVPPAIARIIERMMAKDPAQRYPTYAELLDDLARAAPGRGEPALATGRTTLLPMAPVAAPSGGFPLPLRIAAVLLVAIPLLIWIVGRSGRSRVEQQGGAASSSPESGNADLARLGLPANQISGDQIELLQRLSAGDTSPEVLAAADGLPGPAAEAVKAALRARTLAKMRRIAVAVEARFAQEGQLPSDLATVASDMGIRPSELNDAWGRPILLETPSYDEHQVISLGPDGVRGNADDIVLVNGSIESGGLPEMGMPGGLRGPGGSPPGGAQGFDDGEMPVATRPAPSDGQ